MPNVSRGFTRIQVLNNVATTGIGSVIDVRDFLYVQVIVSTSGNANATIKFPGSMVDDRGDVNFAASAGPSNEWDYIAAYNLQNPSTIIAGDTGLVYAGTDAVEQLIINVDGVNFLTANVTARAAGNINVTIMGYTNQ
jgi:hypothetical protein